MAAGKDYTVKLDIETSQAISNIDHLLQKVQTLNTSVTNLDDSEIALNVVIRNAGFQNMVANVNKALLQMEKETKKASDNVSNTMSNAFTKSADSLTKPNNGYDKAMKEVAKNVKSTVEGSLKGIDTAIASASKNISKSLSDAFKNVGNQLTDIIAESVTKGMVKGFRGMTSNATRTFNAQNLTFKTNFDQLDEGLGKIRHVAETLDNLLDELAGSLNNIRKLADTLGASDARMLRDMAKGIAGSMSKADWSRDNMSLKDRRHAEVENRRVAIEEKRLLLEEDDHAYNQELNRLKAENQERREAIKLEQELKREERKNDKEIETLQSQQKLYDTEVERSQRKLADEEEKRAMIRKRRAEQLGQIEQYNARESQRIRLEDTEIEKALNKWEKATLRIKQQINSSNRNLAVDESAIAQAAKDKKDAEIIVSQQILRQVSGYKQIKESSEATVKSLQRSATAMQRWSSAVSSIGGILSTFRQLSNSMASVITKAGTTFLGYARQAASSISTAATEQYRQLELAQIGFTNFYGEADAKNLITQIKDQAMRAPGVDAGDLADYVKQLAPVSNGNSQVALDAAMGMLKTIQYGGGEASEEMEYVIKNIRDVISKGTATAIDLRQFNRAMPIMEDVLSSIGKSDFIKNGHLKIDKNNAKELLQAFADINNDPNSPVVGIFDQMANTLSGIKDVIKQTFITRFNDALINLGFYDRVKEILKDFYNSGIIEKFYSFLAQSAVKILNFVRSLNWNEISSSALKGTLNIWNAIKNAVQQVMQTLKDSNIASLLTKALNMVANFIKGFSEGVSQIIKFVNQMEKVFGKEFLNNLAYAMGLASSPLGKLMQSAFSVVQQGLNLGSRLTYNIASKYQQHVENKLDSIDQWVKAIATTERFGEGAVTTAKNGVVKDALVHQAINAKNVLTGGSYKNGNKWYWDKTGDTFARLVDAESGEWSTYGGLSNLRREEGWFKSRDIMNVIGEGSTLKGYARVGLANVKNATAKLGSAVKKTVKTVAYYETGKAISAVAGGIATAVSGDASIGKAVQDFGDIASAAIAAGSQFGALGTAAGLLVEGFRKMKSAIDDMHEAAEEYAKTQREIMYRDSAQNIMETLINAFKEAGKYELGDDIDADAQAKMYDNIISNLKNNPSKTMEEVIKEAEETYMGTRATSIARRDLTERTKNVDLGVTSVTALSDKTDKQKLYEAYYKLRDQGLITQSAYDWARLSLGGNTVGAWQYDGHEGDENYVPVDEDIFKHLSATEIANYLKANGLTLSSEEALTKFLDIAEGTLKEFLENKEYNADLIFKIASGENTYNSWEELLRAAGFVQDGQYGWVLQAKLVLTQQSDADANKNMFDRVQDATANAAKNGNFWELIALGAANIFSLPGALFGWWNKGGFIKPIYRAMGSRGGERGVDTVPAMLQPGEYIMRRSAVSKVGAGVLNALNVGDLSKAAQLLGSRFTNSTNNSRSYNRSVSTVNKYVTNRIQVNNRTRGGALNSYNALANRLATGI